MYIKQLRNTNHSQFNTKVKCLKQFCIFSVNIIAIWKFAMTNTKSNVPLYLFSWPKLINNINFMFVACCSLDILCVIGLPINYRFVVYALLSMTVWIFSVVNFLIQYNSFIHRYEFKFIYKIIKNKSANRAEYPQRKYTSLWLR